MNSHAPRRFCRLIAAFLVPWYTAACYHWQAASLAPAQAVETGHKTLRVTLANGQRHALYRASIVGDSLRGLEYRGAMDDYRPTAVALSDIKRLDVRQIDGAATAAAVVGGVLVVGTIAAIIAVANSDFMGGGDSWSGGGGGSGAPPHVCPLAYSPDRPARRPRSRAFPRGVPQSPSPPPCGRRAIAPPARARAPRSVGAGARRAMAQGTRPTCRGWSLSASVLAFAPVRGEFTISSRLNFDTRPVGISVLGKRNAFLSVAVSLAALVFAFILLITIARFAPGGASGTQATEEEGVAP